MDCLKDMLPERLGNYWPESPSTDVTEDGTAVHVLRAEMQAGIGTKGSHLQIQQLVSGQAVVVQEHLQPRGTPERPVTGKACLPRHWRHWVRR